MWTLQRLADYMAEQTVQSQLASHSACNVEPSGAAGDDSDASSARQVLWDRSSELLYGRNGRPVSAS